MKRLELIQQVKFALARLSDTNAHHLFEQVCLGFARGRISINLIPATGPVSAYGDQGRDGESFWSNVASEIGGEATSYGTATISDDRVALACTLQQTSLRSKVDADLGKILDAGTPIDRVCYFCNSSIPVGERHKMIEEAERDHGVRLDVFDLEALSEHLADPDLFWIAAEYLHIPSSAAPEMVVRGALPSQYIQSRDGWSTSSKTATTFGDALELATLIRVATFVPAARPDLPRLLRALSPLKQSTTPTLAWRAKYEECVATYRGLDDFRSVEQQSLDLIDAAIAGDAEGDQLVDATVILQYAFVASLRGLADASLDSLCRRWAAMIQTLESATPDATPNAGATIRGLLVRLCFMVDYREFQQLPDGGDGAFDDEDIPDVFPMALPLMNRDRGMEALRDLLDTLSSAPQFPLESLAQAIDLVTLSLVDHSAYSELSERLETARTRVAGAAAAASRARERAEALLGVGQERRALRELAVASSECWRGHELPEAALCLALAGDALASLGLLVASKQYYLSATWIVGSMQNQSDRPAAASYLVSAAAQDYALGNWLGCLATAVFALEEHGTFAPQAFSIEAYPELATALQLISQPLALANSDRAFSEWLAYNFGSEIPASLSAAELDSAEVDALLCELSRRGWGPAFSDAQPSRGVRWTAYGVEWEFEFSNSPNTVLAAERLIAAFQATLALIDDSRLEWMSCAVHVSVQVGTPESSEKFTERPRTAGGLDLSIVLQEAPTDEDDPPDRRINELGGEALQATFWLLAVTTLTPPATLHAEFDRVVEDFKPITVRLYDDMARLAYPRFDLPEGSPFVPASWQRESKEYVPTRLSQAPGLSPTYDHTDVIAVIDRRYEASFRIIQLTLPRVLGDENCLQTLRAARARGYLDWHLLGALVSLVISHRVESLGIDAADGRYRGRVDAIARADETSQFSSFPLEDWTADDFGRALHAFAIACLPAYGLELRSQFPDPERVEALLRSRFAYFDDDVDHARLELGDA